MAKVKFRGGTLLGPLPTVMATCGDEQAANIITIAWAGILNTIPPKTYISVRPTRFSHPIIRDKEEFVLNLTPAGLAKTADYCGTYTGAKVDKFEKCHLTKTFVEEVSAPLITECPLSLCCKVSDVVSLGSHDMFIADVVAVYADEELLDENGKLHMERADLCAYLHGEYFSLGKRLGRFGFSAVKPKKRKPHQSKSAKAKKGQ